MALSPKIINKRLRSLGNTKKITKAMEMVAAAKMRKAVNAVLASRTYAETAWQTLQDIVEKINNEDHPLLEKRDKIRNICVVLFTSNRGLCGGFNNQLINFAHAFVKENFSGGAVGLEWVALGKKGALALARHQEKIVAEFEKPDAAFEFSEVSSLTKMIIKDYLKEKYDAVYLAYTDFISALKQVPRVKKVLPCSASLDQHLGRVEKKSEVKNRPEAETYYYEYLFEPYPYFILNKFFPHLIQFQFYQALLESNASEHSARMMAMHNASDATEDMIAGLALAYNQARQATITREIAEIAAGKAASD